MSNQASEPGKRVNRWMVAFLLALLAFEVTREALVIEKAEPVAPLGYFVEAQEGFVQAEGQWIRTDGGSPIVQGGVVIQCRADWGTCLEVNTMYMPDGKFLKTMVDVYRIDSLSAGEVTYSNSVPCAVYRVRVDIAAERVFATRVKPSNAPADCNNLEQRVALELGEGVNRRQTYEWLDGEFLPLFSAVRLIF